MPRLLNDKRILHLIKILGRLGNLFNRGTGEIGFVLTKALRKSPGQVLFSKHLPIMAVFHHRWIWVAFVLLFSLFTNGYTKAITNKRSPRDNTRYTVHEKPPELVVNANPDGVKVQAKPSKLQVIAYPHLQPFHPFEHTAVLGPHSPPVNIGPNAPPVHIAAHVPAVHLSPRVPSLHFGTNAPLLHVRPHVPFVHMTPPLRAINAITGPPVHVMSPSTVYHQSPIVFHQPHFAYPGYGYGGGFYGRQVFILDLLSLTLQKKYILKYQKEKKFWYCCLFLLVLFLTLIIAAKSL